jgi:hypothetical protein
LYSLKTPLKGTYIIKLGKRMAPITYEDLGMEFLRIQLNLARIINKDVCEVAGMFQGSQVAPQKVDGHLKQ